MQKESLSLERFIEPQIIFVCSCLYHKTSHEKLLSVYITYKFTRKKKSNFNLLNYGISFEDLWHESRQNNEE